MPLFPLVAPCETSSEASRRRTEAVVLDNSRAIAPCTRAYDDDIIAAIRLCAMTRARTAVLDMKRSSFCSTPFRWCLPLLHQMRQHTLQLAPSRLQRTLLSQCTLKSLFWVSTAPYICRVVAQLESNNFLKLKQGQNG